MTLPEPGPPSKPRRWGLYLPFAALLAIIAAWSAAWLILAHQVAMRLDGVRSLTWQTRRIDGVPFRIDVTLASPRLGLPSGWTVAAPAIKAEASTLAPGHWVFVAPRGFTLARPGAGPLVVSAKTLRASLSETRAHPPRFSLEGLGLVFTVPPGARPFFLDSASELHVHTRAGPSDQGAALLEVDGGRAAADGWLASLAGRRPVTLVVDGDWTHAGALSGPGSAEALRRWTQAGGSLYLRRLHLAAGDLVFDGAADRLAAGLDGRLAGVVRGRMAAGARSTAALAVLGGASAQAAAAAAEVLAARATARPAAIAITFEAGQTTFGPVSIGPAPRLF